MDIGLMPDDLLSDVPDCIALQREKGDGFEKWAWGP